MPVLQCEDEGSETPIGIYVDARNTPRLMLLNKTCRLCLHCETLIVDRAELERAIVGGGFGAAVGERDYVVLGTIDRRTWRRRGRRSSSSRS